MAYTISAQLTPEAHAYVLSEARRQNRSISFVCRELLEEAIEERMMRDAPEGAEPA